MRRILRNPLFIFFILYLISAGGLQYVTGIIEATGSQVPDLLVMPGMADATAVLTKLRASEIAGTYLVTLWTLDVLFPIAYTGLLITLIAPTFERLRFIPLVAASIDLLENIAITSYLSAAGPTSVGHYVIFNSMKWSVLAVSLALVVVTRAWHHREVYLPRLRRLALR